MQFSSYRLNCGITKSNIGINGKYSLGVWLLEQVLDNVY